MVEEECSLAVKVDPEGVEHSPCVGGCCSTLLVPVVERLGFGRDKPLDCMPRQPIAYRLVDRTYGLRDLEDFRSMASDTAHSLVEMLEGQLTARKKQLKVLLTLSGIDSARGVEI